MLINTSRFKIARRTILCIAIISYSFGCARSQFTQLNQWIRVESSDPTTIIPHIWYLGDSWGRIQLNKDGIWTKIPRRGKSKFRVLGYKNTEYALAIENEWGGAPTYLTIYKSNGQSVHVDVNFDFDEALPLLNDAILLVSFNAQVGEANSATIVNLQGHAILKYKFEFPDEVDSPKLHGACFGVPVFQDQSKVFWKASKTGVKRIGKNEQNCIKTPGCVSYASRCD